MSIDNQGKDINSYFAASNSAEGFISYFNNVFARDNFDKIFILKGGPGTGKSSFMNSVLFELSPICDNAERIFCSSDTNSLDGIILEKNSKRIAIIDGTAPHTTDPVLPGVIDEIINLGEFWDEDKLNSNKKEIIIANKKKSEAYSYAYNYLKICGFISNISFSLIEDIFIDIDKNLIDEIVLNTIKGKAKRSDKLLSSYSKNGFTRLNTINKIAKRKYYTPGVYGSEYIFMDKLYNELKKLDIECIVYPSAMFKNKIDTIFIPSNSTAIMSGRPVTNEESIIIDTAKFIEQKKLSTQKYRLEYLWHEREVMLWGAIDEFKKASDEHFFLESIYTNAMNFEKEGERVRETIEKIKKILKVD